MTATAFLALCAALALNACSSSDGNDKATDESPTVTQSPTASTRADPEETAKKEAIATYGAYWHEMEKLYADRTGKSARLDQYAASAALRNAEADAKSTHDRGLINTGDVSVTKVDTEKVDASGKIPNATLSSCLDISRWRTINTETKKPVTLPSNRLTKYVIVSTVEKYPEGWRVTRDDPQGESC
ncbi:hypothetical protein ACFWBR_27380 [Streptomyces sp. NPDC060006]|uniref:hypothetical protein n=1 Tax=unclassified Streptomyces TaxID=2593676 RepID=UPI0036739DCE